MTECCKLQLAYNSGNCDCPMDSLRKLSVSRILHSQTQNCVARVLDKIISSFFISAIEFLIDDEDSLPKQVKYAIRLRSEVYSPWNTDSTYPQYIPDSPASAQ